MAKIKKEYVVAKDRAKLSAGEVIKMTCELNDITQAELAHRSGIQSSNLSDIISGRRKIGRIVAEKIAKVLNVSPAFILFGGETSREGADIGGGIDVSLLEHAIQAVEDNKNKNISAQLGSMRLAIEFIAKAILSINLIPKRSHVLCTKRQH